MAKATSSTDKGDTSPNASTDSPLTEGTIPATVAGDDGQAATEEVPAARAAGSVPTVAVQAVRYSTGEGTEAGNTATQDYYLDSDTGEVVNSAPERGRLIAVKGSVLEPAAARMIADNSGS